MTETALQQTIRRVFTEQMLSEDERRLHREIFNTALSGLEHEALDYLEDAWTSATALSSYIGNGENQINPRDSLVGFRDCLPVHTLREISLAIWMGILGGFEAEDVFYDTVMGRMRLIWNDECPVKSKASRTGVILGATREPDDLQERIEKHFPPSTTTPTTTGDSMNPDTYSASLDQLINAHDVFVRDNEGDFESAESLSDKFLTHLENSADTTDQTGRIDALRASIQARALSDDEFEFATAVGDDLATSIAEVATKTLIGDDGDESDGESDSGTVPTISVKADFKAVLDTMLSNATSGGVKDADDLIAKIRDGQVAKQEADSLRKKMGSMSSAPTMPAQVEASGDIPEGEIEQKLASDVFKIKRGKPAFKFEIPVFKWDSPHPHVPAIDPDYIFQAMPLLNLLQALVSGERSYLVGHTGTGKTTLIEQTLARMNWPMIRINFDSEITRMDLMGRDVLTNDGGVTTSKFVDGVLPTALNGPYVLVCDEVDRIRAEVSYVFNRMLEGNGLLITEDGGRYVNAHPMHRLVANANTVGQGDDFGLYQGARPQSQAFLDRFTRWMNVEYLKPGEEKKLLMARSPALPERFADAIMRYVKEHREAFVNAEILQPLSPRGVISWGQTLTNFLALLPDENKASSEAFEVCILNRASPQDRAVLKGIHNRAWTVATEESA